MVWGGDSNLAPFPGCVQLSSHLEFSSEAQQPNKKLGKGILSFILIFTNIASAL